MSTPKVLIVRAPGTNCDVETEFAFRQAGAATRVVHLNQLREQSSPALESQILCFPGGFSFGDDLAAGRIFATQFKHFLSDVMHEFRTNDKLVLGICNGFQILMRTGLFDEDTDANVPCATLTDNDVGMFQDRWVDLMVDGTTCAFLAGVKRLYLPMAHAEGKFVPRDTATHGRLCANGQLCLRYRSADQNGLDGPVPFPSNPNGSVGNVAGMCDGSGRIFGLMPHPERYLHRTQHPQWTRRTLDEEGQGMSIFRNAVAYFA
ncbi:MAG: phosphoribosylformylglycinamidine synthase subunit PurQ [Planctomycetales bacterium]|nr:phosphoribosylformylglycinamidine synthase subunit PurQ [Planctomycetales bacterium]